MRFTARPSSEWIPKKYRKLFPHFSFFLSFKQTKQILSPVGKKVVFEAYAYPFSYFFEL